MGGFIMGVVLTLAVIYPAHTKVVVGNTIDFIHGAISHASN